MTKQNWILEKEGVIDLRVPSGNTFKGKHWSIYSKVAKRWLQHIWGVFQKQDNHNKVKKIKVVCYHPRLYDEDNFIWGCKPIADAFKDLGWIVDDRKQWLVREYDQVLIHKSEKIRTVISIYKEDPHGQTIQSPQTEPAREHVDDSRGKD